MADGVVLLVALALIGIVGYIAYAKARRDQQTFNRLYQPADERLLGDEDTLGINGSLAFMGEAAFTTRPFDLPAGAYKLLYQFPQDTAVKVDLFSVDGSDHETLGVKSGEGAVAFRVAADGRYFCTIEPAADAAWEIEIMRLGLPSSSA